MTKTATKTKTAVFIHPYNGASESAKALTKALGGKRILTGGRSKFKPSAKRKVINWGSSTYHVDESTEMLNKPEAVAVASNKLTFFEKLKMSGTNLVPFTSSAEDVQQWLDEGHTVVARQRLQGHSGAGIVMIYPDGEITLDKATARLYTKYVKKAREYRVHVVNGKVIRVQKKILRPELTERINDSSDSFTKDDVNWEVRNHKNGFIYVTGEDGQVEKDCPEQVKAQAISAVRNCGLNFGAVDLIWNNKKQSAFVLEINTSPGLEGGTIEAYTEAFQEWLSAGGEIIASPTSRALSGRFPIKVLQSLSDQPIVLFTDWEDKACEFLDGNRLRDWCEWEGSSRITGIPSAVFAEAHRPSRPLPRDVVLLARDLLIYHNIPFTDHLSSQL